MCLAVLLPVAPGVGVPEYVSELVKLELTNFDSEIKSENELDAWGTLQVASKVIYKAARGIDRKTDFLHLFSGADHPGAAFREQGLTVRTFEILDHPTEDLYTCSGLAWAGILSAGIRRGGMALLGPYCGSWSWISRGTSLRTGTTNWGDDSRQFVRNGNKMALFVSPCSIC